MKHPINKTLIAVMLLTASSIYAQDKKVWLTGASRAIQYGDSYNTNAENDTTTARKLQSGHAMVDLGVNIQPNDKVFIQSVVRVRNDYGGFWGSGVTFDVRQLYVKGVIGEFLKYQLGDINYKLTPYTFYNNTSLVNQQAGVITEIAQEQLRYDLFYRDENTWRQQGAAIDFALLFDRVIDEAQFNLFTTRIRPTNFGSQDDRLYTGGSVILKRGENLKLGGNYANLYDFDGTSNNTIFLRNPVITAMAEYNHKVGEVLITGAFETGRSTLEWQNDPDAPKLEDYFYDAKLRAQLADIGFSAEVGYRDVGQNFRSAGAQSMRIDFQSTVRAFERYGNAQNVRQLAMADLARDPSLYNTQIEAGLQTFDPRYNNATPYGVATPNRRGISAGAQYKPSTEIYELGASTEILSDVVGLGTSTLKTYNTHQVHGQFRLDKLMNWQKRKVQLDAQVGMQQTKRDGQEVYEQSELTSNFGSVNLTATIFGDFELLGEYRFWNTKGDELVTQRNAYSEVIDFNEYSADYQETVIGTGLRYNFSDKNRVTLLWQQLAWDDSLDQTLPYELQTWSIFFTVKF